MAIETGPDCTRIYNPENPNIGGLNISRTIGDFWYKSNNISKSRMSQNFAVSTESDVREIQFFNKNKDDDNNQIEFILIGCDGIWEGSDFNDKAQSS